jgi:hypothetical protein
MACQTCGGGKTKTTNTTPQRVVKPNTAPTPQINTNATTLTKQVLIGGVVFTIPAHNNL